MLAAIARRVPLARRAFAGGLGLALGLSGPARAFDLFEIQVYGPDHHAPGEAGLEVHLNWTPSGIETPAFPGETPPNGVVRLTFEPSLGVLEWLELGGYLMTSTAPGIGAQFAGWKLRAKAMVPERITGPNFFLGLNGEISWVTRSVDLERWATELRPIIGWGDGVWYVWVNPIVDMGLSGPGRFRPTFAPAAKVAWNTQRWFSVGIEYYADLGFLDAILPSREQEHLLLAAFDLVEPRGAPPSRWEMNLGIGAGLTPGTPQHFVVKTIIGRTF